MEKWPRSFGFFFGPSACLADCRLFIRPWTYRAGSVYWLIFQILSKMILSWALSFFFSPTGEMAHINQRLKLALASYTCGLNGNIAQRKHTLLTPTNKYNKILCFCLFYFKLSHLFSMFPNIFCTKIQNSLHLLYSLIKEWRPKVRKVIIWGLMNIWQ